MISKYLIDASNNYNFYSNAEAFMNIIKGVEKLLPDNVLFYHNRKAIAQLFYDIQNICSVNESQDAENDLSLDKLINTIIAETDELVPENTINYSDIFLYDFLQGLFGYCELNEISNDDDYYYINIIATGLNNIPKFSPMRCRIDNVVEFLKKYDPQIDENLVYTFINSIISKMMKKFEITDNIAKLIK